MRAFYYKHNFINLFILINLSLIVSFITLFLPLGFSPDSINYQILLNNPSINTNLLLRYISYILNNYQYVNFLYSLIMLIIFSFVFYRMSKIPLISYILFLFLEFPNFGLIQIRSGVAIAFFYLSLYFFVNEKKLMSFLLILIGTFFHISLFVSLIIILLLLLPKRIFLTLPLIGILLHEINIFQIFINLILQSPIKILLPNLMLIKLEGYIQSLSWDIPLNHIEVFSQSIIVELFIFYLFYIFINMDKYEEMFFKLFGIGLFLWFFLSYIPVFSQRFINYLIISQFFLVPTLWKNFKFKPKTFGFLLMFIFIILIIKQSISRYIFSNVFNFALI